MSYEFAPLLDRRARRRATALTVAVLALAALAVTALAVAGCTSHRLVVPVTLDPSALAAPSLTRDLTDDGATVRTIATILTRDLALPVPDQVTVFVYGSRAEFAQGLIDDAHVSPARATELSHFAAGIGKRAQLLLLGSPGEPHGREWVRLIAHEMTHVAQFELAQGEGRAAQWLAEGMAEWVAFRVLEQLGFDTFAGRRAAIAQSVARHGPVVRGQLDLETLGSPRGFTVRHLRDGSRATYQMSFLMADYLIQRDGFETVVEYFRDCAVERDRDAAFEDTFGESIQDFEAEVLGYLRAQAV